MMKKLLTAFFCLLISSPALATDIVTQTEAAQQQQELEQNLDNMSKEVISKIQETSRSMQQAIPLFSQHFQEIIRVFNQEMAPVMQALEENKNLLKADPAMAQSLQNSLPSQYGASSQYRIDPQINELSVSSEIINQENSLKYNISRNLASVTVTQSFINKINAIEEAKFHQQPEPKIDFAESILNLDNQKLKTTNFKLEEISNLIFLVDDDTDKKETFMFGNLTPELNIRVQTSGPKHQENARKFVESLDKNKLEKAVNQK